jgi:hypothetical protein
MLTSLSKGVIRNAHVRLIDPQQLCPQILPHPRPPAVELSIGRNVRRVLGQDLLHVNWLQTLVAR